MCLCAPLSMPGTLPIMCEMARRDMLVMCVMLVTSMVPCALVVLSVLLPRASVTLNGSLCTLTHQLVVTTVKWRCCVGLRFEGVICG